MSPLNGKLGGTLQIAAALGPIGVLALIGFLFMNGYLQNPETKDRQSLSVAREVVGTHESAPGHAVIVERVDDLEDDLLECRADVKEALGELTGKVEEVRDSVHRIELVLARYGG